MDSREIVRRTLDFEGPERVARSFGDSDFANAGYSGATLATSWREVGGGRWERTDVWGNTWARVDETSKGEVARGVLDGDGGLDHVAEIELPDFADPDGYDGVKRKRTERPDKWLVAGLPGFAFNIARKLRRLDQYLVDLYTSPDEIHALHDRLDAILETMIWNHAAAGADAVMFPEDWGTQDRLMIDPALWREEFGPRFRKLCGVARECGVRVFMHSCGQIEDIVPDLIRAGVDLLQFDQPELHGLDTLASHHEGARITFWCPVDIQKTLQSGDEALVRERAREMLDKLWRGRGGFVAGFYWGMEAIGVAPALQGAASDEFATHGVRSRYSDAGRRAMMLTSEQPATDQTPPASGDE